MIRMTTLRLWRTALIIPRTLFRKLCCIHNDRKPALMQCPKWVRDAKGNQIALICARRGRIINVLDIFLSGNILSP